MKPDEYPPCTRLEFCPACFVAICIASQEQTSVEACQECWQDQGGE